MYVCVLCAPVQITISRRTFHNYFRDYLITMLTFIDSLTYIPFTITESYLFN